MGELIRKKSLQQIILPKGKFSQNQKQALYSLISCVGQENFDSSNLKKSIEFGHWDRALKNWEGISSESNLEQIKQRAKEINLFFSDL